MVGRRWVWAVLVLLVGVGAAWGAEGDGAVVAPTGDEVRARLAAAGVEVTEIEVSEPYRSGWCAAAAVDAVDFRARGPEARAEGRLQVGSLRFLTVRLWSGWQAELQQQPVADAAAAAARARQYLLLLGEDPASLGRIQVSGPYGVPQKQYWSVSWRQVLPGDVTTTSVCSMTILGSGGLSDYYAQPPLPTDYAVPAAEVTAEEALATAQVAITVRSSLAPPASRAVRPLFWERALVSFVPVDPTSNEQVRPVWCVWVGGERDATMRLGREVPGRKVLGKVHIDDQTGEVLHCSVMDWDTLYLDDEVYRW